MKRKLSEYNKPVITIEKLDELASSIFSANKVSTLSLIMISFKFIIALSYILVRRKIIKDELEVLSQDVRNNEIINNQSEVDDDIPNSKTNKIKDIIKKINNIDQSDVDDDL